MEYTGTRDSALRASASQAVTLGLCPDGGLFVPAEIPALQIGELCSLSYTQLAEVILPLYLTDLDRSALTAAVESAYSAEHFGAETAPVVAVADGLFSMELWHGPTCAFKDYALQLLPALLAESKRAQCDHTVTLILVATSGDTGKAALEGFRDKPGMKIAVFYPSHGTSEIQRLQMATQRGENVAVFAVEGNFDDAQTAVKKTFSDASCAAACAAKGIRLSSANSINWGRLVPQIVYYFSAYVRLVRAGAVRAGSPVDFCVPTGNFGDILAGYYAKRMGLPVRFLICASNRNNVLTDFGGSGEYNADRPFYRTASPSMDILVSSNLERLLWHESGDPQLVRSLMAGLSKDRRYRVPDSLQAAIGRTFRFGFADETECADAIRRVWSEDKYLCDPHTAVAMAVAQRLRSRDVPCVVLSTASPCKFPGVILRALGADPGKSEFDDLALLAEKTKIAVPPQLAGLASAEVRFSRTIRPEMITAAVEEI